LRGLPEYDGCVIVIIALKHIEESRATIALRSRDFGCAQHFRQRTLQIYETFCALR
jgi:hypothetical protein